MTHRPYRKRSHPRHTRPRKRLLVPRRSHHTHRTGWNSRTRITPWANSTANASFSYGRLFEIATARRLCHKGSRILHSIGGKWPDQLLWRNRLENCSAQQRSWRRRERSWPFASSYCRSLLRDRTTTRRGSVSWSCLRLPFLNPRIGAKELCLADERLSLCLVQGYCFSFLQFLAFHWGNNGSNPCCIGSIFRTHANAPDIPRKYALLHKITNSSIKDIASRSLTLSLPRVINIKFPCSLTRNITSHSMENLAFHSLLRW